MRALSTWRAHAQRQGLDALQDVEGVGRAHAGAEIAQALGARPHDEGRRAELLGEVDAVIAGIGLRQRRKLARRLPVEAAAVDQHAADGDAMAAQPLGRRMHDDIGAVLERPAQVGRGEGVVDHQRQPGRVRDLGDRRRCPAPRAPGLPIVSPNTSRVSGLIACAKPSGRADRRSWSSMPKRGRVSASMLRVPP